MLTAWGMSRLEGWLVFGGVLVWIAYIRYQLEQFGRTLDERYERKDKQIREIGESLRLIVDHFRAERSRDGH